MKDVLTIEIGENESAKFWLYMLNNLKHRSVTDILVLYADGLPGIKEPIEAAFPMTEHQRYIVYMVCSTLQHPNLYSFLFDKGYQVHAINPIQSDAICNLFLRKTKNDAKDSFIIAETISIGRF